MWSILHCPKPHSFQIDPHVRRHLIAIGVRKFYVRSKPVDHIIEDIGFHPKSDRDAFPGEHIDMLRHVLREIDAVFQSLYAVRRPRSVIQQSDVCDAIKPIVTDIAVGISIADEIVSAIGSGYLIRTYDVFLDAAFPIFSRMERLIESKRIMGTSINRSI